MPAAIDVTVSCTRKGCSPAAPCRRCAWLLAEARADALRVILDRRFTPAPAGAPCDPS